MTSLESKKKDERADQKFWHIKKFRLVQTNKPTVVPASSPEQPGAGSHRNHHATQTETTTADTTKNKRLSSLLSNRRQQVMPQSGKNSVAARKGMPSTMSVQNLSTYTQASKSPAQQRIARGTRQRTVSHSAGMSPATIGEPKTTPIKPDNSTLAARRKSTGTKATEVGTNQPVKPSATSKEKPIRQRGSIVSDTVDDDYAVVDIDGSIRCVEDERATTHRHQRSSTGSTKTAAYSPSQRLRSNPSTGSCTAVRPLSVHSPIQRVVPVHESRSVSDRATHNDIVTADKRRYSSIDIVSSSNASKVTETVTVPVAVAAASEPDKPKSNGSETKSPPSPEIDPPLQSNNLKPETVVPSSSSTTTCQSNYSSISDQPSELVTTVTDASSVSGPDLVSSQDNPVAPTEWQRQLQQERAVVKVLQLQKEVVMWMK
ncbi:uncharacterized protein BYT42DRAFT_26265 [Radiomyces spectabilis]|uniref:uncharacterized protein n=1 Tax=Radiomyces spectabilis TaxID=64574 RepID=UPI00221EB57A|nr:uncharacterized protein BYT42DRAFT_26265 [Radiomyces spectabilis]KAI8393970.1 hypothetical protein BYT42DRAFT_26265 [Radiomyces spectabilis]